MFMKKHILTFFIFLAFQILIAKDANVFLKQVELEKIYTSKVTNFLDKMFDASDYYVFADVQLIEKLEEEAKSDDKKDAANTEEPSDPFGYTFIEGLGLDGGALPTLPGAGSSKSKTKAQSNNDDYVMTGLKISVYLSENIYNVESRETITNFVNTNIQEIRNCFDCFVLDKMPSKGGSSKSSEELRAAHDSQAMAHSAISALRDSLKWSIFQQEQQALRSELEHIQQTDSREIELLERQIDEASSAREFWEDQEARRKELQNNLDSLKFVSLIEIEKEYRSKTNDLLDNMTGDYEGVVQARLDDAKSTEARLFSLLENNSKNSGSNEVDIESWSGDSGFGLLPTIMVVIIIVMAIGLLILKLSKKKVVYLKPKQDPPPPPPPRGYTAPPTESNENSDVIRSEIRSLRQSAVTMSAGQRDGASQIITDWLDESSPGDDADGDNSEDKEE